MATVLTSAELDLTRRVAAPAVSSDTAPYVIGDRIMVEFEGMWMPAVVDDRQALPVSPPRFGLRWRLLVLVEAPNGVVHPALVLVDDNGRNHTWRKQVCPAPADR